MAEITEKRFPRIVFTDSQDNSDIGGGGSSDLSIANVKVSSDSTYQVIFIVCADYDGIGKMIVPESRITQTTGYVDVKVPLYGGTCVWACVDPCEVACTGDIEFSLEEGAILIHGDGTITITGGTT